MEYKDIEKLVNEAETLYQNTQEGYVQDSDTILKDLVDEAYDGDYTGLSLEIFKTWKTAQNDFERKLVEEMFMHFTGWQFKEYLEKCVKVMRYYQKAI